ncbi:MAG: ferritin-like domain-containing protein [Alphaproteobacteria bacterium]|nr:ferritin-like domain-containing protein [Alphaproteobacteria bacterium]MDE2339474.1 ferritin-like domain-containing protein [Alphaproteobacteria bacterium]
MLALLRRRYLDVLASVYVYNEHRGYTSIDRVIDAVVARHPEATAFIAKIRKHRDDEYKHYFMFQRYYGRILQMPLHVDRTCGQIDHMIQLSFGCSIDDLATGDIVADEAKFRKLCRVIALTEMRGLRQVERLRGNAWVRSDAILSRIFKIIEADEPSHFMPYLEWLAATGGTRMQLSERLADIFVHRFLLWVRLPLLFLNPALPRLKRWPDETEPLSHSAIAPI